MQGQEGLFVSMPSQPGKDGKWYQVALPATKEKRSQISEVILSAYKE